ncbi:MAG: DCC1-like thiol-disulfide oxidoreductase family protein [Pseudomonadota bacterium]
MNTLRVLYNSVCPVCREGICHFKRKTQADRFGVVYIDVSQAPEAFEGQGVRLKDVRRKLHAILPDGTIVRGWPAVSALWRWTPGYGWLAKLGDMPGLRIVSGGTYAATAQILWRWNRASGRW